MPQPIGYNFAPTTENSQQRRGQADQAQRAVQTLSFQLPTFVGASRKLSPLQGQQMAGSPISQAVLESVLKTILGDSATMGSFEGSGSRPEVSPDLLSSFAGQASRAPTIHPGDQGDRRRLEGENGYAPGFGPEAEPITKTPGLAPSFDRPTSPTSDWMRQEQGMGTPAFSGGMLPEWWQ